MELLFLKRDFENASSSRCTNIRRVITANCRAALAYISRARANERFGTHPEEVRCTRAARPRRRKP